MSLKTLATLKMYRNKWITSQSTLKFWDFVQFQRTGSIFFDIFKQGCSDDEIDVLCLKHAQGLI